MWGTKGMSLNSHKENSLVLADIFYSVVDATVAAFPYEDQTDPNHLSFLRLYSGTCLMG